MTKVNTMNTKLTRGDKAHKKFIEKLDVFKDGLKHGMDSLEMIHKQTLDSSVEFTKVVSKSQEVERTALYDIIKKCEDETRRKEAFKRLAELDRIKEKEVDTHNDFLKNEREKANRNITGGILCLAVAGGLISSKQVRQMSGKALTTISKNLLRTKE